MADLKLGKLPARHDPRDLRFATYLEHATLPALPITFGHEHLIGDSSWAMLGNDNYGDCVWAGAAHETMLWTRESKTHPDATFDDAHVLSDYSAVTGFDPNVPNSDQGTDMTAAAAYRRKTGVIDTKGRRHKVGAFLSLSPGNVVQVEQAAYLFSAVGIGIQFPASAMDQFNQGKPWNVVAHSPIEGGHYVPVVGVDGMYLIYVVTWGRLQPMTFRFFATYCDEALAYLSTEMLAHGTSLEGFNLTQLQADLAAL